MYDEASPGQVGGPDAGRSRDRREGVVVAPVRQVRRPGRSGLRTHRPHGPRPVRPAVVRVPVRPVEADRPACRARPPVRASRQRVLVRRPPAASSAVAAPGRRLLAGLAVAVLTAAVVIGWGQLLGVAAGPGRAPTSTGSAAGGPGAVLVTVGADETVWELARRIEPEADGARLAALAERIAVANSLSSVELQPGRTLRIPTR
jgi:hypothetical protein